mgnify:CR=1 FL=1
MKVTTQKRTYWPTKEWRTADPASLGLQPAKLTQLERAITSQYRNINGLLIVKEGQIAYEKYFNKTRPGDTHHVASVTKSVTSALIGMAIDAGNIASVEQKVLDFFPEIEVQPTDTQKRALTIRHLLTMTAPFAWKGYEPLDRLRRQKDWTAYIFKALSRNGRFGKFQYSTASTHLLSVILTRATGMCAQLYANEQLFRPLGMREIPDHEMTSFTLEDMFGESIAGWPKDPDGNTTGGWGLRLTPRDMARFGFLYLNRGLWDDQQIISESWVTASTARQAEHYGYLWWLREANGLSTYAALGAGGNVICCIPAKDLVVVIAAKVIRKPRDPWQLLEHYILPAIHNEA